MTEDFKPFEGGNGGQKSRDSPKRYNYKPMNYPNFVMDRKSGQKFQNNGLINMFDGSLNMYNRTNKKGSYNFHRPFNNNNQHSNAYKMDQNDTYRNVDNFKVHESGDVLRDAATSNVVEKMLDNVETAKSKDDLENMCNNVDFDMKRGEKNAEKRKSDKTDKTTESQAQTKNDETRKYNEKQTGNKKKNRNEATAAAATGVSKEPSEMDDDGFTKVRYRGHGGHHQNVKKQKSADHHNENVNWIVPGRENKEQN